MFLEPEEPSGDLSSTYFENNRKALTFPDSCNEVLHYENAFYSIPCTNKNRICQCFGTGISTTVTRKKACEYATPLYLNTSPRKKAIFRNTKGLPKYSLLKAKISALESFIKNASWQAGFDCVIQINAEETKLLLS